jgi:hypothetical protein
VPAFTTTPNVGMGGCGCDCDNDGGGGGSDDIGACDRLYGGGAKAGATGGGAGAYVAADRGVADRGTAWPVTPDRGVADRCCSKKSPMLGTGAGRYVPTAAANGAAAASAGTWWKWWCSCGVEEGGAGGAPLFDAGTTYRREGPVPAVADAVAQHDISADTKREGEG